MGAQPPPAAPQPPLYPPSQQPTVYPPRPYGEQSPKLPANYQEPVQDMGTSLGYGQGMEYQYFEPPQPSQPIPQLRQERLQQLREERMRRQQRRMNPDITSAIHRKGPPQPPEDSAQMPPQMSPSWGPGAPPSMMQGAPPASPTPPVQMSPVISLPPAEVSPVRSSTAPPQTMHHPPAAPAMQAGKHLQAASAPAQDTGMLQRMRIGRATLILTGAFIASRVLGLLRTSIFAYVFGTGHISDAYLQAFLIPDLIFNIVAGGALSSAFIPVFTHYMVGERDERTAWHIANSALNLAIAIMMVFAFLAIIFAGQLVPLYNHGEPPDQLARITLLTRIMLLQSIILGGGVIVTAILNSRQNFMLPAIGTVLYNVGLIAGLIPGLFLAFHGRTNDDFAVDAAAGGVVLGAILQVGFQLPGLAKVGMHFAFSFDWRHPGVLQIGRQMIPRIINSAMLFCSIFVDRSLILLLVVVVGQVATDGLITQYVQALQLLLLPLGIFGMAVSTAAFPTLAENVAKGRLDRVRSTILETLRSILFMSIPSSIGLIVLGLPIIQVLLEHGAFNLRAAESTSFPLAGFAIGLAGLASAEILTRAFYALRDSVTPVIVSVAQFIFKIALSIILINVAVWGPQWGTGALAFSTSIAGLVEAAVLLWLLHQRIGGLQVRSLSMFVGRILLASLAMGVGVLICRFLLDLILVTTHDNSLGPIGTLFAIVKLLIEMFVGLFIYIRGARFLGIEELGPVKRVLDRFKLHWI